MRIDPTSGLSECQCGLDTSQFRQPVRGKQLVRFMRMVFLTDAILALIIVAGLSYGCTARRNGKEQGRVSQDQQDYPMARVRLPVRETFPNLSEAVLFRRPLPGKSSTLNLTSLSIVSEYGRIFPPVLLWASILLPTFRTRGPARENTVGGSISLANQIRQAQAILEKMGEAGRV